MCPYKGGTKLKGLNIPIKHQTQNQKSKKKKVSNHLQEKNESTNEDLNRATYINKHVQPNKQQTKLINQQRVKHNIQKRKHSSSRWYYLMIHTPPPLPLLFVSSIKTLFSLPFKTPSCPPEISLKKLQPFSYSLTNPPPSPPISLKTPVFVFSHKPR